MQKNFGMTVNFTNILQAAFSNQSSLRTFYVLTIWVCNFLAKDIGAKAAHKMLVKLTPGGSMGPRYVLQLLLTKNLQKIETLQPLKLEKKQAQIWNF